MKTLLLLGLLGFIINASAQTNIINISNSKVVINNYTIVGTTNTVQTVQTNTPPKMVVIPQEWLERLRWEGFLLQRQQAYQHAYLRRIR